MGIERSVLQLGVSYPGVVLCHGPREDLEGVAGGEVELEVDVRLRLRFGEVEDEVEVQVVYMRLH